MTDYNEMLKSTLWTSFRPLFALLFGIFFIMIFAAVCIYIYRYTKYQKSIYRPLSQLSFWRVFKDAGSYGEYLTVDMLSQIPGNKKILINTYLPKAGKPKETTEIDVLLIHTKGIFVFESKNYSGWIFGKEKDRYWTQCLNGKTKLRFYNPICQNATHIKALQTALPNLPSEAFKSFIVFSERCELKKLTIESDTPVIKRNALLMKIVDAMKASTINFDDMKIEEIYYAIMNSRVTEEGTKEKHIEAIKTNYKN